METQTFFVVRNHEGQYSIWDSERLAPAGWDVQTSAKSKDECLEYIRQHWVDMTPLSLMKSLQAK
jgi:MbtH protein